MHIENKKKTSKISLSSEKETEPTSKPDTKQLSDIDLGFELVRDEEKDSVSDIDESNDCDYLSIKPFQPEVKNNDKNFIGLSIPLISVDYNSEDDTDLKHLEERRHSRTCRNKKREVKYKAGDMTSNRRQNIAIDEIKEGEDSMEDEPDNPAERDQISASEDDGKENIGGFGHFISSNGLSDESLSPSKLVLNKQLSTFTIFSKEEMKSSKFIISESDKSIKKSRVNEQEKRLLFDVQGCNIFDQAGCVSQKYKNSFEEDYDINSEYIFKLQSYFSRGSKDQQKYEWEEMKKTNDYSIYCGSQGSLVHSESPAFMIKIKFDKKFSYEMIVD